MSLKDLPAGALLHKITQPYSPNSQISKLRRDLETLSKRTPSGTGIPAGGGGGGEEGEQPAGGLGNPSVPTPELTDAMLAYTSDFTQDGIFSPSLVLTLPGELSQQRGFVRFLVKVGADTKGSYVISGVPYPDAGHSQVHIPLLPQTPTDTLTVQAACVSALYGVGPYSNTIYISSPVDQTPPPTPAAPRLSAKQNTLIVTFPLPVTLDYSHTEVWKGTGDFTLGTGALCGESKTGVSEISYNPYSDNPLLLSDKTIKIRHLDKSGNSTPLSPPATATPALATATQVVSENITVAAVRGTHLDLGISAFVPNGNMEVPDTILPDEYPDGFLTLGGQFYYGDPTSYTGGHHLSNGMKSMFMGGSAQDHVLLGPKIAWVSGGAGWALNISFLQSMSDIHLGTGSYVAAYSRFYDAGDAQIGADINLTDLYSSANLNLAYNPGGALHFSRVPSSAVPAATVYLRPVWKLHSTNADEWQVIDGVRAHYGNDYLFASNLVLADAGSGQASTTIFASGAEIRTTTPLKVVHPVEEHSTTFTATNIGGRILNCTGTITVNLPSITYFDGDSTRYGSPLWVKNVGAGTVTIDGYLTETIEGALTLTLSPGQAVEIIPHGLTNWVVLSSYGIDTTVVVRKYAQDFGDGAALSYVITHNLATRDAQVQIRDNTTPYAYFTCTVEATTTNTVTLRFSVAPATNQYRVIIFA